MEKKCSVEDLVDYRVLAILEAIGWGSIFTWSGNTYASSVFGLYESICASTSNSFTIRFLHGEEVVTAEKILSVMGLPRSVGQGLFQKSFHLMRETQSLELFVVDPLHGQSRIIFQHLP